jgi:hypothetical protein
VSGVSYTEHEKAAKCGGGKPGVLRARAAADSALAAGSQSGHYPRHIQNPASMTYVECPHCGGKALNVATRCPQCGGDFPSRPLQRGASVERTLRVAPLLLAATIVILVTVIGVALSRSSARPTGIAAADSAGTPLAATPRTATSRADTTLPASAPARAALSAGDAVPAATTVPAGDAVRTGAPVSTPTTAIRRYARTWTHVRTAPTRAAASTLVLDPGDTVQVDSLRRGWYRVLMDGRAVGYVHRSNLDVAPPSP